MSSNFFRSLGARLSFLRGGSQVSIPRDPSFDISRIEHHPDKQLLARISKYYITLTTGDFNGMTALQADDLQISDISLEIVRASKQTWNQVNSGFSSLMTNILVEAISLYGSSEPGSFALMECVIRFTLAVDPPPEAAKNLPPGIKKGDRSGMIMLSAIWWNQEGLVYRDLEYGRLIWDQFDINAFKV
ncbi:hypothetical protein VHEMI07088 [[Torrubiella] hemipterigena]|uniref:SnoaL-like domain-containing protein n=1 Tax=[Torrubiella] hemipterigena TaxID=1531966 RepID=A0A0A1TKM8_9HYPO|nr:hypothetical protein VHEMI07088 [[Torrubiella] hemipterigena]